MYDITNLTIYLPKTLTLLLVLVLFSAVLYYRTSQRSRYVYIDE